MVKLEILNELDELNVNRSTFSKRYSTIKKTKSQSLTGNGANNNSNNKSTSDYELTMSRVSPIKERTSSQSSQNTQPSINNDKNPTTSTTISASRATTITTTVTNTQPQQTNNTRAQQVNNSNSTNPFLSSTPTSSVKTKNVFFENETTTVNNTPQTSANTIKSTNLSIKAIANQVTQLKVSNENATVNAKPIESPSNVTKPSPVEPVGRTDSPKIISSVFGFNKTSDTKASTPTAAASTSNTGQNTTNNGSNYFMQYFKSSANKSTPNIKVSQAENNEKDEHVEEDFDSVTSSEIESLKSAVSDTKLNKISSMKQPSHDDLLRSNLKSLAALASSESDRTNFNSSNVNIVVTSPTSSSSSATNYFKKDKSPAEKASTNNTTSLSPSNADNMERSRSFSRLSGKKISRSLSKLLSKSGSKSSKSIESKKSNEHEDEEMKQMDVCYFICFNSYKKI